MTTENVEVRVGGNADGVRRAMDEGRRSVESGASDMRKAARDLQEELARLLTLGGIVKVVKDSVTAFNESTAAMMGMAGVARYTGNSFESVTNAARSLSADGLMTMTEASRGLQNLLMRGFNLEESVQLMNRFKDSAAFNRQASLQFGQAVVTATEGLKNENSVLVDNAGVTKNVSMMWKEYAAAHGKSVDQLTMAEKRQAEYNGILTETEGQLGDAARMSGTFAGELAKTRQAAFEAKAELGQAMVPTLGDVMKAIRPVIGYLRDFIGGIQMMTVSIAGLVDKAAAVHRAGGLMGMLFKPGAREQVKREFAAIDAAVEEQKAEIFRKLTMPVGADSAMTGEGGGPGPRRKDADGPDKPKNTSRLPAWKSELEAMLAAENNFFGESRNKELAFWEQKLSLTKKGSAERRAVEHEIFAINRDLAKEELAVNLQKLKDQSDAARSGSLERIDIARQEAELIKSKYGEQSKEYAASLRQIDQMHREFLADMNQREATAIEGRKDLALIRIEQEQETNSYLRDIGVINGEEELRLQASLEERKTRIEMVSIQERLKLQQEGSLEQQKLMQDLERAQARLGLKLTQMSNQAATQQRRVWDTVFDAIESSLSRSVTGMITGTMKLRDAMRMIATNILGTFVDMGAKMFMDWVRKQIMMTTATQTQNAVRTASTATAETTAATVTAGSAMAQVGANAAVAASGAAASQSSIPYVGPILAAVAAAAMLAMVLGFRSSIASAAGGWDYVDRDQMAMVHQREMILPAELADRVRGMTDPGLSGGGGGAIALTINALDAKSVRRLFADNGPALTASLRKQVRNFNSGGKR